jgi:type IV secretory pathway TraG/TraD family ATPase VirD4
MTLHEDHVYGLIFLALLMAAAYAIHKRNVIKATLGTVKDSLASVLLWWGENDAFTVRELLNGGIAIFGRTGSGKTSSSGKALANAIVRHPGSGGLILAAKPEDTAMWQAIFAAAGRSDDLLVFSPENPLRFNFLDYEMQAGGHTRNITRCITVIGETLRSSDTTAGENADFWQREQERMIFNSVEIVKLATGKVGAPELQKFISTAAMNSGAIATAEWQAGFHNQCLKAAFEKRKTPTEQHDFDLAKEFWLGEFPNMADKTRSSIMTGVMGILHTFNTGVVRELVSTTTNVTPDDMFAGKWVLIDTAPSELGDIGNFVCAGWKYLTQKAVLRRHAGEADAINVIWCDEAQQFVNSHDAHYVAQCRSHKGCMVYLTQSLHSYYSALKGETGKHQADALLTNFHHKVFHALGDVETAEFASGLIGKELRTFIGGSMAPQESVMDELMGHSKYTGSFNQHYEKVLQDNVFMNGLRTGGKANGLLCDCIVLRSGEPFASGQNWLWTTFSQE